MTATRWVTGTTPQGGRWRMSMPGRPKSGPSFPTTCQHKVPRNQTDQAMHAELSARFRAGDLYAYSYQGGRWLVWATQADWDATERTTQAGRVIRDPEAARAGHGPSVYQPAASPAPRAKKPGKAEYVAMLRRIYDGSDWDVAELEALLAAA